MDFPSPRRWKWLPLVAVVLTACNKTTPDETAALPKADASATASEARSNAGDAAAAQAPAPNNVPAVVNASFQQPVAGVDTSLITEEYFAALIVHPRQILQKQTLEGESRTWLDTAAADLGVALTDLEQITFLLGPPEPGAANSPVPLTSAWIFRFATPAGQQGMLRRFLGENHHREVALDGRVYYKDEAAPLALCAPNDRTVLLASERHVKRALAPTPARSLLLTRLAATSGRPDVVGAVDAAPLRPLLRRIVNGHRTAEGAPPASPWVRQLSEAMYHLKEAKLTADFADSPLARLTLEAEDTQSAAQLEQLAQGYRGTASLLLGAVEGQWVRGEHGQGYVPLFALARDILARVTTAREMRRTTIEIGSPPALAELPKILESAYQAAARGNVRAERVRRLQLVGLALHNHHVVHGSFPATASRNMAGRPLLSWRVHLLPYLGQEELYKQFRLDQPWDSPHNSSLLQKIPAVYQTPGRPVDGQTRIVGMVGPGTPMSIVQGTALRDFTDGPDNTILMVECGPDRAVPWTQPDDLPFDPQDPLAAMGAVDKEGFLALYGDGRVEIIRPQIAPDELRALLTHAGGESPTTAPRTNP